MIPAKRPAPEPAIPTIRAATVDDLDALVALENACFTTDVLSRRSFRHFLTRAHADTYVAERVEDGALLGYALVVYRENTALARLYSIAVDPAARGLGLGDALLERAEHEAREGSCAAMRLEVQPGNRPAIDLYERRGYRTFGRFVDYYEDHSDALRMEKILTRAPISGPSVPYYRQTLDFTCGAASLLMALHALDPSIEMTRVSELRLWREATSIFMTSGHGGCGPHGLALAAARRGFRVAVHIEAGEEALFVETVRSEEKKEVIRLVESDFVEQLEDLGVEVSNDPVRVADLRRALDAGAIPIVLISLFRLTRERTPHWVTVTGVDDHFVSVHDPWVEEPRTVADSAHLPIAHEEFEGMARYGRRALRATVLVSAPDSRPPSGTLPGDS